MAEADTPANLEAGSTQQLARRKVLLGAFLAALAGAYGFFATIAVKFVFPLRRKLPPKRVFLGFTHGLDVGQSRVMDMPSGDQLLLSNTGQLRAESGSTFLAFSNRCPHLGCKVHWVAQQKIFSCPCHQGVFNPEGVATSGPPAESGQSLAPYRLEIDGNSIYALVEEV